VGNQASTTDTLLETVLATAQSLISDDLGPDDSIWDFGCDSLTAIQLLNELSDARTRALDPAALLEVSTCRQLADVLRLGEKQRRGNVSVLNADAPRQPLVIVGGGGSFALTYRPLTNEIGDRYPITLYEQRGLQRRGPRDHSVHAMARRCVRDLRRRQPHGPYVLIGHSWGAVVVHEMARLLVATGERAVLVLLDGVRYAPTPEVVPPPSPPERIRNRADRWPIWAAKYLRWKWVLRRRALAEQWRMWRRPLGSLERYRAFYLFALRTMKRLELQPLDIPVVLVHPQDSPYEHEWDDHPNVRRVVVGGDHNTMILQPHVIEVAETIVEVARSVAPGVLR